MTSLTVTAPLAAASPATATTPPVFGARIIIGLVGVLLAVLVSGLNEMVTKVALADIRGALHIGYDEGTWLVASYTATSVAAMAFAPWCSVTFRCAASPSAQSACLPRSASCVRSPRITKVCC